MVPGQEEVATILLATQTIPYDSPLPQDHATRPRDHPGTRNCAVFFGELEFYFRSMVRRTDEIRDPDHVPMTKKY